ncbi:MAG TPA: hypothetical protein VG714_08880 [Acidobacteriaceae bacterium]|nr:hypothetical protein [Acidobacteriaceae bacterium]
MWERKKIALHLMLRQIVLKGRGFSRAVTPQTPRAASAAEGALFPTGTPQPAGIWEQNNRRIQTDAINSYLAAIPSERAKRRSRGTPAFVFLSLFILILLPTSAQTTSPPAPKTPAASAPQSTPPPPPAGGDILFSRGSGTQSATEPESAPSASQPAAPSLQSRSPSSPQFAPPIPSAAHLGPGDADPLHVTNAERTALTFTAYDLDLHLTPASAGLSAHALLTVRNDGTAPISRLILQLSSTLHWDSISLRPAPTATPAAARFTSRLVDTDTDHTGTMSEAVVTLPEPLGPGASLSLIALYSGSIPQSANRLTRIGAPGPQAAAQDWDAIAPADPMAADEVGTALRGFGNVLWYPVSAPPAFLGDGAKLFALVGRTRLREADATFRLRLAIEYSGEPPDAAYLCGRRAQLQAISDNPDLPIADAPGIATAAFDARPIGFRTPSLFVTARAATLTGPPDHGDLIAAITGHDANPSLTLAPWNAAAAQLVPMLSGWLGPQPSSMLTILDHPGDPYEDDALLVHSLIRPLRPADTRESELIEAELVRPLTHAWIQSTHPWIDQGLPEFMSLLWTERTDGRTAALSQLAELVRPLALTEPDFTTPDTPPSPDGASLAQATGETFYRNKAAAVWWMLRSITGDDMLKQALQAYRGNPHLDRDPHGLQQAVEAASHMDLAWFFRDWIYQDRGLPDLSIVNVTPSQLGPSGSPANTWLVAVEVRNDGSAEAQVPVTVRSADATETRPLRVPGHASASVRIVFTGRPDQVQVNDGTVPETQTSVHTRQLVMPTQ